VQIQKTPARREQSMRVILSITLASLLVSALAAPLALAHGEHGEATPVFGGMRLFSFEGFQIELLGSPRPLRVGTDNRIVAKIFRGGSVEPVRNGKISMGVVPARVVDRPAMAETGSSVKPDRAALPLSPITEQVWAGSYTLTHRFTEKGPHLARLVIAELDGKVFNPPAVFDFYLNVEPAPGMTASFLVVALTSVVIAVGAIYSVLVLARSPAKFGAAFNLLDISWLRRLVTWRGFQPALQVPMLALIVVIAFLGFFDIQDGAKNLATKLAWILWWPGIIFTFILVGRLWCVMCPFGALNEWAANIFQVHETLPQISPQPLAGDFFVFSSYLGG